MFLLLLLLLLLLLVYAVDFKFDVIIIWSKKKKKSFFSNRGTRETLVFTGPRKVFAPKFGTGSISSVPPTNSSSALRQAQIQRRRTTAISPSHLTNWVCFFFVFTIRFFFLCYAFCTKIFTIY